MHTSLVGRAKGYAERRSPASRYGAAVKIVASDEAAAFVREHGGTLWVWLDPHTWVGGTVFTYLESATERPGTSKATRRRRSGRRPHRFHPYEADGYTVQLAYGTFGEPEELHLELKRFPKRRVDAYWNGAIFVGEDIPPPSQW